MKIEDLKKKLNSNVLNKLNGFRVIIFVFHKIQNKGKNINTFL